MNLIMVIPVYLLYIANSVRPVGGIFSKLRATEGNHLLPNGHCLMIGVLGRLIFSHSHGVYLKFYHDAVSIGSSKSKNLATVDCYRFVFVLTFLTGRKNTPIAAWQGNRVLSFQQRHDMSNPCWQWIKRVSSALCRHSAPKNERRQLQ